MKISPPPAPKITLWVPLLIASAASFLYLGLTALMGLP